MNFVLIRHDFIEQGVFGMLLKEDTKDEIFFTLEHAYAGQFSFTPKIPPGQYLCKRGVHRLEGKPAPFETFEVTDVPGHSNILFHVGNYNQDSSGCILLGMTRGDHMILESHKAFSAFMQLQNGVDSFTLIVE